MSWYSGVATLRGITNTRDTLGNFTETIEDTDVFVDVYEIGLSTWLAGRSAGLHADAEIRLRTLDYSGQQRVLMDGVQYEVESVRASGVEFTRLVLRRRLNDYNEPEPEPAPVGPTGPTGQVEQEDGE